MKYKDRPSKISTTLVLKLDLQNYLSLAAVLTITTHYLGYKTDLNNLTMKKAYLLIKS